MKDMKDSYTIRKFIEYLSENRYLGLRVDRWPDKENSTTPDIDAVAGPFAIEHTSIDTLSNQRKSDDWFLRIIGDLESELASELTINLMVRFEYELFTQKHNWKILHKALKRFIVEDTPNLGWGYHKLDDVPSIPFTLHLDKSNELPFFGLRFARFSPQELSLGLPWCRDKKQPPVPDGFREKLENKVKKLAPYKVRGKTTVLLIESIDIAFMNDRIMLKWLKEAYSNGLPDKVDRIWYAARFNSEFIFKDFTVHIASDSSMMQIDMQGY